ncbi:MAG: tetratricopeptide repeat protein [Rhodothermales bacterium]
MERAVYISDIAKVPFKGCIGAFVIFLLGFVLCMPEAHGQVADGEIHQEGVPAFESREALKQHLAQTPSDFQARRQYADMLFEDGEFREAVVQYERFLQYLQGAPDIIQRYLIAIASYPGDEARGIAAAEKYLSVYPMDFELYMRLGYFRLWRGNFDGAQNAFEQALLLNPDHTPSQQGLAEANAGETLLQRLENPPPTDVSDPSAYPQLDERRYRFIYDLVSYNRYFSAYEQLMLLAERHDGTQRWLELFSQVDNALVRATGNSPVYPIDRFRYLLAHQPDNLAARYALVDEYIKYDRIEEAYRILLVPEHVDSQDAEYVHRLQMLDTRRSTWIRDRIVELEKQLAEDPGNESRIEQLIGFFQIARRPEDAVELYRRWLGLYPELTGVRYQYAQLLLDVGIYQEALTEVETLLGEDDTDVRFIRLYVRIILACDEPVDNALALLNGYLEKHPENVDVTLDLSEIHLHLSNPQEADVMLRRAFTLGLPDDRSRLLYLDRRIEQALRRNEISQQAEVLNDARSLAVQGEYDHAIRRYEDYFELKGTRTRADMEEFAKLYSLSGDYEMAASILEAVQRKKYTVSVAKEVARNRYYLSDHSGAIRELEAVIEKNPRDAEAREFLQQVYLESQRYAQADSVYLARVDRLSENSRLKADFEERMIQRISLIERSIDTDFVGLVVPISQYTRAKGSITSYEHWAQGLLTQVTLPASPRPFMITAGLVSHFVNGTRRLLQGTPNTLSRINQVMAGSYFDLTPPVYSANAGYTNRIWLQFGVFDYSGARTVGFADLRYLKQVPKKYTASIGARTTEGALQLWSPAGGEFGLRLTQFDIKGRTVDILPDSTLRVSASFAYNIVKGRADSTLTRIGNNAGTELRLEASYRVLPHTYLGLSFNNIDYKHTLETYFSPQRYQAYDIWVEYERELITQWFWRTRATTGLVSYRRGAFAARLESDLIYRFNPHLSLSLSGSGGYSVRFLDGQEVIRDEGFKTFVFTGALYWTL